MKKIFTHSWATLILLGCFIMSTSIVEAQTTTTKTTTTTTVKSKTTSKKPAKKKKAKKKVKKTVKKATKPTVKKVTPAVPATPATPAPKSTPAPKPTTSTTVEQSMRLAGSLTLSGTSTLHDWKMTSNAVQGSAYVTTADGELEKLSANTFILPVRSLKSDNSSMSDNAYEALKEDKFKDIRFVLTSSSLRRESAGHYAVSVNGNLTIAGVTRAISSSLSAVRNGNAFTCTGSYKLKMSEFNIDRPSFMLGAMKTGDAVTINYNVTLQPR